MSDIEKLAKDAELNIPSQTWAEVHTKLKQFAEAYHAEQQRQQKAYITEGNQLQNIKPNNSINKPIPPLPPVHTCTYSRNISQKYPRECIYCGKIEQQNESQQRQEQEPVATIQLPDPYDERSGVWFDLAGLERLKALPTGTKLFTTPLDQSKLIESQASEIAELNKDRDTWMERATNEHIHNTKLQSHINELREALNNAYYEVNPHFADNIKKILASTPSQSLQAHDDEVIERCAVIAEDGADSASSYQAVEAIRALKGTS